MKAPCGFVNGAIGPIHGAVDKNPRHDSIRSMSTAGQRLKALREARGLSGVKLAEQAGVDAGYVSRVENDQQRPGLGYLAKIAPVLGLRDVEDAVKVLGRFRD